MEKILEQILNELKSLKDGQGRIEKRLDAMENDMNGIKQQTANLIEFRTEANQNFSDIKDTLKFLLHKEVETERDLFALKEANKRI